MIATQLPADPSVFWSPPAHIGRNKDHYTLVNVIIEFSHKRILFIGSYSDLSAAPGLLPTSTAGTETNSRKTRLQSQLLSSVVCV